MQAYADWRRFGLMPAAGGSFDQPAELLREMRIVHSIWLNAEKARQSDSAGNRGRGGRRGSRS